MWDDPRRTRSRRGPGHARAIRRALKNAHPARGLTANPKERIVVVASRSAASARAVNHRRARTPTTVYASPAGQPPRPQNAALRRAATAAAAAPRLPHLPLRFAPRRANARIRALAPLRPARPPAAPAIGVIPGGRPRAPALRARSARGLRPAHCVIAPSGRTPHSGLRAPRAKTHRAPKEATSTAAARPQSQRPGQTRRRAGDRGALRGQTHAQPPRKISREPYARPTCAALTHPDKEKAAGNVSRKIPRSSCACTPSVPKLPSPAARHVVRHSRPKEATTPATLRPTTSHAKSQRRLSPLGRHR